MRRCQGTRLFLTGRFYTRDEAQKYVFGIAEVSLIGPRKHGIGLYLSMWLKRGSELGTMDEELDASILKIIPEVTLGMYVFS